MLARVPLPRLLSALAMTMASIGASSTSCQVGGSAGDGLSGPSFVTTLVFTNASGQASGTFAPGERIDLALSVRNRLSTPASLQFPSARTSDFVVVRENTSAIVWQWSEGRSFAQALTEVDFTAGETKTFTVSWDQTDNDGDPAAVGSYEARGAMIHTGFDANPLASDPLGSTLVRFTIR